MFKLCFITIGDIFTGERKGKVMKMSFQVGT